MTALFLTCLIKSQCLGDFALLKEHSSVCRPGNRGARAGPRADMAAGLLDSEDAPCSWDFACRVLRTCREGNLQLLQLMLKPWCIPRTVYQVGPNLTILCFAVWGNGGEWWRRIMNDQHLCLGPVASCNQLGSG